jgi:uncharacterized protein YidB (DUF937 family)
MRHDRLNWEDLRVAGRDRRLISGGIMAQGNSLDIGALGSLVSSLTGSGQQAVPQQAQEAQQAQPTEQARQSQGGGGLNVGQLVGMLGGVGGVTALLSQLRSSGLGNQVMSWIGGGRNEEVTPQQVDQALGHDAIQQIAQQAGVPEEQVTTSLAGALPQIVDQYTPNGQLPTGASA